MQAWGHLQPGDPSSPNTHIAPGLSHNESSHLSTNKLSVCYRGNLRCRTNVKMGAYKSQSFWYREGQNNLKIVSEAKSSQSKRIRAKSSRVDPCVNNFNFVMIYCIRNLHRSLGIKLVWMNLTCSTKYSFRWFWLNKVLPSGQGGWKQGWVSSRLGHFSPPLSGTTSTSLVREEIPAPQVVLQSPYSPQSPTSQSTTKYRYSLINISACRIN